MSAIVSARQHRLKATAIGFVAVILWSLLALLTVASGRVPPFQLVAMCFLIGGLIGLADIFRGGRSLGRAWQQPARVWLFGVGGLFGYHFFYFTALRNAVGAEAEAGLIAYLWPLLIVLFSALLPGERLRSGHVVGALLGFGGAAVILSGKVGGLSFDTAGESTVMLGLALALVCALVWTGYSVGSRIVGEAPTDTVAGFCLVSAVLGAVCHLALEETVWPLTATELAGVIGLGLGPVGLAFYAWDIGVKRGDIQLLGVSSYAAPLLSTLILVVTGFAQASLELVLATGLIVVGSLLAARASLSSTGGAKPSA
ncbi:MAG: EamA family transporter [Pseudomonadota bacterium]